MCSPAPCYQAFARLQCLRPHRLPGKSKKPSRCIPLSLCRCTCTLCQGHGAQPSTLQEGCECLCQCRRICCRCQHVPAGVCAACNSPGHMSVYPGATLLTIKLFSLPASIFITFASRPLHCGPVTFYRFKATSLWSCYLLQV